MRILIATTYVPFTHDPAVGLVEQLRSELNARGFITDVTLLPFAPDGVELTEQTAALRLLDLRESCGNRIDRLIAVRYPAFALRHPNKVVWFTPPTDTAADLMRRSDTTFLRECRGVFTTAWAATQRLRRFYRVEPHGVLYPPLPSAHCFRPGPFGDYLLCTGSPTVALDALPFADPQVKLVVVGDPSGAYRWSGRVTFTGPVSDERRAELLAGSRGLVRLDQADDPFGYAALEAFHAQKPVLASAQAVGTMELVQDGNTGLVCQPVPAVVGSALTRLWTERAEGERMGQAGHATLARAGINWDAVVRGLAS